MSRLVLVVGFCLLLAGCGGSDGGGGAVGEGPRDNLDDLPNFIVVVLDDWGWRDYGDRNPGFVTPNIDAIAADGFVFDNAFLATSSCSPSRASTLMGRYPTDTGAPHLHDHVPPGFTSIPEALGRAGYYTESSGKWHLGSAFRDRFDKVRDTRDSGQAGLWPQVLRQRPEGRPFFLWLASFDPHVPHDAPPEFQVHDPELVTLPDYLVDTPAGRVAYANYMNSVHRADFHIGLLLEELEAQGLLENTWLFLLADNGAPTPFAKTTLYDTGIKTPLLVMAPGVQGSYSGLVSSVDLAPTILDIAGLEVPPEFQGNSFLKAFQSPDYQHREYVFAEQNNHGNARSHTAIRSEQYLLIRNRFHEGICAAEMNQLWRDLKEVNEAMTATPLQSLCFMEPPPVQFFKVGGEGYEAVNLVDNPDHEEQEQAMTAALDAWESQYRRGACPDIECAREVEERRSQSN